MGVTQVPGTARASRGVRWAVAAALAAGVAGVAAAAFVLLRPAQPAAAVDPGPFGGIEVGAKGVKPIVIQFLKTATTYDFNVLSADDKELKETNTDLGTPAAGSDKEFDPARVEATAKAVEAYRRRMADHYKLPPERIAVVVSSGVFSGIADGAAPAARAVLAEKLKGTGPAVRFITTAQEGEYAAVAILSKERRTKAVVVDIGSGNMRVTRFDGAGFAVAGVEYGTGKLQRDAAKAAADAKRPYPEVLAEFARDKVAAPLRAKVAADPGMKAAEADLVGGAAWAMTTLAQPARVADTRVKVGPADVARLAELATLPEAEAKAKALAGVADPAAAAEVDKVQKVFKPEQLAAAAALLRAVFDECALGDKPVTFFRKGQHAWIAGVLIEAAGLRE